VRLLLVSLLALALNGQYDSWRKSDKSVEVVMPAFPGTVRGISAKSLNVEVHDENMMLFNCSKKTVWLDGTKKIKPDAVKAGDLVIVEARKAPDGSLDAVYVRLQKPKDEK